MKNVLFFFAILLSFSALAQETENSIYFPQEQLIHPDCIGASDTNDCLKNKIEEELLKILHKALVKNKVKKDTLTATLILSVDGSGKQQKNKSHFGVSDRAIDKKYSKAFDKILKRLPKFEILNRKSDKYFTKHIIKFPYLVEKTNSIQTLVPITEEKNPYTGGTIEEAPLYPGCERGDELAARQCFQNKIQKHISENFHYPEAAQAAGIQGKVWIIFTIDENGDKDNIRFRGPHKLLEQEAARIIGLLPQLEPGLHNGKAVRIPFSIPITFRLR